MSDIFILDMGLFCLISSFLKGRFSDLLNLYYPNKNLPIFRLNRIRFQTATTLVIQTLARPKREILFMKRTSHLRLIALRTNHAAWDSHLLSMWTHILGSKPFAASSEIENSDLFTIEQGTRTAMFRHIRRGANGYPFCFFRWFILICCLTHFNLLSPLNPPKGDFLQSFVE